MFYRTVRVAAAVFGAAVLCAPLGALAQTPASEPKIEIAKPKPNFKLKADGRKHSGPPQASGERKTGELEGWTPSSGKSKEGSKEKDSASNQSSGKSRGPSTDGGLPLPETKAGGGIESGVGFDKGGNFATGVKF